MTTPIDLIISQMGEHITLLYGQNKRVLRNIRDAVFLFFFFGFSILLLLLLLLLVVTFRCTCSCRNPKTGDMPSNSIYAISNRNSGIASIYIYILYVEKGKRVGHVLAGR